MKLPKTIRNLLIILVTVFVIQPAARSGYVIRCQTDYEEYCWTEYDSYIVSYYECWTEYEWVEDGEGGYYVADEYCEWVEEWVDEEREVCELVEFDDCWQEWVNEPHTVSINPNSTVTLTLGQSRTYSSAASAGSYEAENRTLTAHGIDWKAPGGSWVSESVSITTPGSTNLGALTGGMARGVSLSGVTQNSRSVTLTPTQTGTYTVRFTAQDNVGNIWHSTSHNLVVASLPELPAPAAPGFIEPQEANDYGYVDIPYSETVNYFINGQAASSHDPLIAPGYTVTVTAEPAAGYSFPSNAITSWTHTFGALPTSVAPQFIEPENGNAHGCVIIPHYASEAGSIIYRINGNTGIYEGNYYFPTGTTVTVTVEPAPGFFFPDGTVTTWTHTFGAGEPPPANSGNNAVFVSSSNIPSTMTPGQTVTVSVTMQNTGSTTWGNHSSHPYSLGSQNPQDNTTWSLRRVSVGASPVPPGDTKTFNFAITAPPVPGSYNFQWRMVQDGVEWFGASSSNATISVANAVVVPLPEPPANLAASNITTNSATITWTASSGSVSVADYLVFLDGREIGSTGNTSYALTGLEPSTAYVITVRARDAVGNVSNPGNSLTIITNSTGVTLMVTSFYLPASNVSSSLYRQLANASNSVDEMHIATAWERADDLPGMIGSEGGYISHSFQMQGMTKNGLIRDFLLQIWGGNLTYEGIVDGDHGTITKNQELEQLHRWLKNSIQNSLEGDSTAVAYTVYYDYVRDEDCDEDGNWYYGETTASEMGIDGYMVTMTGSEMVIPTPPQFINPETPNGQGCVVIPSVENIVYNIHISIPGSSDEGDDGYDDWYEDVPAGSYYYPYGTTITVSAHLPYDSETESYHFPKGSVTTEWINTFVVDGGVPGAPQEVTSLSIVASVADDLVKAANGGSITVYMGDSLKITSVATAAGWLSAHNIKGYAPGPAPFSIPYGIKTLAATATTASSLHVTTWEPLDPGTYTIYTEAFTGTSPGDQQQGVSGWPGYEGGPFGGSADKRITVNVRNNPTGSVELLDAGKTPIPLKDGAFTVTYGDTFYVRVSGSDSDGDVSQYYVSSPFPAGSSPCYTGDGYNGSKTFGPYTAKADGSFLVGGRVSDATAYNLPEPIPWGESRYGWYSSPQYTVQVTPPVFDAKFVSQSVPLEIRPNAKAEVWVTMKNTGNQPWVEDHSAGSIYSIIHGLRAQPAHTTWSVQGVSVGDMPVMPGEERTFRFTITAPQNPGNYDFQWCMSNSLRSWNSGTNPYSYFGESSDFISINVDPNAPVIPPRAPRELAVSDLTSTTATITWTAPLGDVIGYEFFRNGAVFGTTTDTTVTLTGLVPSTTYVITARALSADGTFSELSAPLSITTLDASSSEPPISPQDWAAQHGIISYDPLDGPLNDGLTYITKYNLDADPNNSHVGSSETGGTVPAIMDQVGVATQIIGSGTYVPGSTAGEFAVDKNGSATYSIPIAVTPGTAGVQPSISLEYSSANGSGIAGFGWSLAGLSSIVRGGQSELVDGQRRAIDFTYADRYYFDGQRLVAISGQDGQNGTEYRLESDNFTRVVSYGNAGQGPAWFKAWTKSGLIIELGNTTDSTQKIGNRNEILTWQVNKISDTAGNYMTFEYIFDPVSGQQVIDKIKYTGNISGGVTPYASVQFDYGDRPDVSSGYIRGAKVTSNNRLETIKVFYGSEMVRKYELAYVQRDYNNRSMLASVTESGADGMAYKPITFEYSNPPYEWEEMPTTKRPPVMLGDSSQVSQGVTFIDLDGDGRVDCVQKTKRKSANLNLSQAWLNKAGSWIEADGANGGPDYRLPNACNLFDETTGLSDTGTRFADFNGDGLIDVISLDGSVYLNTGSSFVFSTRYSLPYSTPYVQSTHLKRRRIEVMDLNGDGKPDIVSILNYNSSYTSATDTWINKGEGTDNVRGSAWQFTSEFFIPEKKYFPASDDPGVRHIDVNGDGLVDVVCHTSRDGIIEKYAWINTGSRFVSAPDYEPPMPLGVGNFFYAPEPSNSIGAEFVDLNGDGLPDYVCHYTGFTGLKNFVYLNTGAGWVQGPDSHRAPAELAYIKETGGLHYFTQRGCAFIDINGDGLPDFVNADNNIQDQNADSTVMINTGTSWTPAPATMNLPYLLVSGDKNNTGATLNDFDDDGAIDQAWRWGTGNSKGAMSNKRINPDRLVKATSSLGVSVQVTYAALTERDPDTDEPVVYDKGTGAASPRIDVTMPMHVVKTVAHDDGRGGTYDIDYRYGGLRVEPKRGLLGFDRMQVTDMRTGIRTETFYSQEYQTAGMVTRVVTTAPNGTPAGVVLNESANEFGCRAYGPGGKVYFPYVARTDQITNDLTGAEISTVTTSYEFDAYGNATSIFVDTSDTTGTHTKTTTSIFENWTGSSQSPDRWLLGRLMVSSVTTEAPGVPSQTRTSAFEYDPDTGLLTKEIIEPDSINDPSPDPTLELTTTYEYDDFGNKTKATTEGAGLDEDRVIETTYDSKGRFPEETKNAKDHTETYIYNQKLGVIEQTTGPNDIKTRWEYDGFARPVREIRAYGTGAQTETTTDYLWITDSAAPGSTYLIKTKSSGSAPAITFYDYMGRAIANWAVTPGGLDRQPRVSVTETAYDEYGRAWAQSMPHYFGDYVSWAKTYYDILSRPVTIVTPDEDAPNREVISTIEYDGLVTRTTNPLGQVEESTKNTQGQIVKRINNAGGIGVEKGEIRYTYDAYGNLLKTAVHREGGTPVETTFFYDNRGRKTRMTDPDMGTWSYEYNALGELIKQTDAKNQVTEMVYDVLGRMTRRTDDDGTVTTWTYDTAANGTGKLASLSVTDPNVTDPISTNYSESFTYDTLGRLASHTKTIDGIPYVTGQEYDQYSRPSVMTYPGGFRVKNYYDTLGVLREVRADGGTIPTSGLYRDVLPNQLFWQADSHTVAGAIDGSTYGNGLTYDAIVSPITGRTKAIVASVSAAAGGHYAINYAYLHDAIGQVTLRMDYIGNRKECFAYDGLNRLVSHTVNDNPATAVSYDALGNITEKSDVGSYYYTSGKPHAVTRAGVKNYTYDANGNQTAGADRTLEWSSANQVRKITKGGLSTTFRFGADRERIVQQHSDGTKTVYVGSAYEVVTHSGGLKEEKFHIFTPLGRTATRTVYNDGRIETRYHHQDGLGSTVAVSDEHGKIEKSFAFDPWGNRLPLVDLRTEAGGEITRGFTDHEHLDDFGLIHMNGRIFDPVLARFLSADPFIGDASNAQTFNRYSYVENNPLNATDPSGYFSFWDGLQIVMVVAVCVIVSMATYGAASPYMSAFAATVLAGAASGFAGAYISVSMAGGSPSAALKAGLRGGAVGALTAAATFGIGQYFDAGRGIWANDYANWTGRTLAHATVGGISSELQGGEFRHGFYSSAASNGIMHMGGPQSGKQAGSGGVMGFMGGSKGGVYVAARTSVAALIGGTAAAISGGKFVNGAVTSAMQHLFNAEANSVGAAKSDDVGIVKQEKDMVDVAFYDVTAKSRPVTDEFGGPVMDSNGNPIMEAGAEHFKLAAEKSGKRVVGVKSAWGMRKWLRANKGTYDSIAYFGHGNNEGAYINNRRIGNYTIRRMSSSLSSKGRLYLFCCNVSIVSVRYAIVMQPTQRLYANIGILNISSRGTIYHTDTISPKGNIYMMNYYGGKRK
ncbi:FG-GAP-like repeat-containing protein [Ereboglobus luteus]|uniref:Fibronectin type-III domain-containing protein n=1 Tax=Ereboglobus luteus TaxID=1796921 RepID=A0A2U8E0F8_9BACT|nr:FG-GAP-like repeat-containing protein [Ereboglobus luteus]AWI08316.1 hypothetical protein CKA38_02745 [Ereboglobus luteus]